MNKVTKYPVQSFRKARVGQMMTLNYAQTNQHAVTITQTGSTASGTHWAELTDRRGVSITIKDTDLDKYDLKAVTKYD
jgi:hypothetical protein